MHQKVHSLHKLGIMIQTLVQCYHTAKNLFKMPKWALEVMLTNSKISYSTRFSSAIRSTSTRRMGLQ